MKYISELRLVDGLNLDSLVFNKGEAPVGAVAVIRDTSISTVETIPVCEIPEFGILGVDAEPSLVIRRLLCLSVREATLHEFIDSVVERGLEDEPVVSDSDIVDIPRGECFSGMHFKSGTDYLTILMPQGEVIAHGKLGSVVVYQASYCERPKLMSLYDFLGILCRETDLNVFKYRKIEVACIRNMLSIYINLSGSQDSARYFVKMLIDVTGTIEK